jgi:hypothetical protein
MFPFSDINRGDLAKYSDSIENMLRMQEMIHPYISINENDFQKSSSTTELSKPTCIDREKIKGYLLEAIAFSLQFLRQEKKFNFKDSCFIDCLGYGGEACLYAQPFGFKSLSSVEFNSYSFKIGTNRINQLATAFPLRFQEDGIKLGKGLFLEDYFPTNFRCFFLDTTILRSSMLDESILINRFLQFCNNALPGSFCILITIASSISLSDYYPHGEEIFKHEFSSEVGEYAAGILIFSSKRI